MAIDRFTTHIQLVGGPQDGARVVMYTDAVKPVVWVGPRWLGDGASAFTTDGACARFPAEYRYDGGNYRFWPAKEAA